MPINKVEGEQVGWSLYHHTSPHVWKVQQMLPSKKSRKYIFPL